MCLKCITASVREDTNQRLAKRIEYLETKQRSGVHCYVVQKNDTTRSEKSPSKLN